MEITKSIIKETLQAATPQRKKTRNRRRTLESEQKIMHAENIIAVTSEESNYQTI